MKQALGYIRNDKGTAVLYEERQMEYVASIEQNGPAYGLRSFEGIGFGTPANGFSRLLLSELFPGITGTARPTGVYRNPDGTVSYPFESDGPVTFADDCGMIWHGDRR
jgi:hypothetical protein